jgi:hypothetical protein
MESVRDKTGASSDASSDTGASPTAHERAVVTVRLTLLLLIIGVALFLFPGPGGGAPPSAPGDPAGLHK